MIKARTIQFIKVLVAVNAASLASAAWAYPFQIIQHGLSAGVTSAPSLFSDGFAGGALSGSWTTHNGSWSVSGGLLQQTSSSPSDPVKARITGMTPPANVMITAKIRVDSWVAGPCARAGVGVYTDSSGQGYNFLLRENGSKGVQFLNDQVAWGNSYAFSWQTGTWYWMKLKIVGGSLSGRVWQDGTAEPSDWPYTQTGWSNRSSSDVPALNGGSDPAVCLETGTQTVSFDLVNVTAAS